MSIYDHDYADQRAWSGEDDRDTLTQPDAPPCPQCGAGWDDPCEPSCDCDYCLRRRARQAAQDAHDKDAA